MNIKDTFAEFRDNIVNLVETKIELVKIEFQERTESIIVKVMYVAILSFLVLMVMIFLSILLAVFLNHWLKSDYWGYVIVTTLFILKLGFWILAKDSIINVLKNTAAKVVDAEMEHIKINKS